MAALVAAALTSVSSFEAANASTSSEGASTAVAPRAVKAAVEPRLSAKELAKEAAGRKAGRKAGAAAGAKAGRAAAAKRGKKAAAAGEAAGRKAGAAAGAKAGKKAGRTGGAPAGRKAGKKAGAKAGRLAGARAAAVVAPACGSTTYRKDDGSLWRCTMGEEFDGTSLNPLLWRAMTSDKFAYGVRPDCFVNSPNNISVAHGMLTLTSRKESKSFVCNQSGRKVTTNLTAGMVSTYDKWTQAYGRFEFRARLPWTSQDGVQTSMWLWPEGASGASWPASGEIDVAEWYSHFDDRVIPYLHQGNFLIPKDQTTNNYCLVNRVQDWHTYLLEWTPAYLRISYDGKQCLLKKGGGAPFNKAYMISMFQGYGLQKNKPTSATPAVSRAQFAWVRVWS
ncbi:glycoside hydrolase family 16 protein [Marmoricola sp. OAE513]|uniref:glycoside hydrolase family 16 protein n=1 Tax=Marmoricola sp. OAE513 TaxID=2817894 RepID=UPI001AE4D7EC